MKRSSNGGNSFVIHKKAGIVGVDNKIQFYAISNFWCSISGIFFLFLEVVILYTSTRNIAMLSSSIHFWWCLISSTQPTRGHDSYRWLPIWWLTVSTGKPRKQHLSAHVFWDRSNTLSVFTGKMIADSYLWSVTRTWLWQPK